MRPALHRDPAIDPAALSAPARDRLAEELTALQQQIFAGVSPADFRAYVVDSPARRTRIEVFRATDGTAVGFAAVHLFEVELEGRTAHVLRAEVGMLRAYRGQSAAGRLLAKEAVRARLRFPHRPLYFVACPVHPASYLALARTAETWPRPQQQTPAEITSLMGALDAGLRLERPDAAGPHVRKVGWITRQTAAEQELWATKNNELVRFYVEQNPDYIAGAGLRTVSPIDLSALVTGLARFGLRQLRRACARLTLPRLALA